MKTHSGGISSASRSTTLFRLLAFLAALAAGVPEARGVCPPGMDNCASALTSVTDNVLYVVSGPFATFTFLDESCASASCALDNSASALHGAVTNTAAGSFTYTFDAGSYSGPEKVTYTKGDGSVGTIEMTVCATEPCTVGNPTAQLGTYAIVDNALKYTPDVALFGQPAVDNLSYTVTDGSGRVTTVSLNYVYPSYSAGGTPVVVANAGPGDQPFKRIVQGTGYNRFDGGSAWFSGDSGSHGGTGSGLVMNNAMAIATVGGGRSGIQAHSLGGNGQAGEDGGTKTFLLFRVYGTGGDGGWGGGGGDVAVNNTGSVTTDGAGSHGIWAMSRGGDGGYGGDGSGAYASGGSGAPGGRGGAVTVNNVGDIATLGEGSDGIRAESLSGQGGRGGNGGGWFTTGGSGSFGVQGGSVRVDHAGAISTGGGLSHGIFAQSVGGGGGAGGDADGWFTGDAGDGGGAGNGGNVDVVSDGSVTTAGIASDAIFAQSVGGGGGGGGSSSGWYAAGGSGVGAGHGGNVSVVAGGGPITALGGNAKGIFAQSVGGSGGGGGSTVALGAFFSVGVGGNGGDGGNGGAVSVSNASNIRTAGDNSSSIIAQSVGGGGGWGGYAIAGSVGGGFSGALSIGGSGAAGGDGGAVSVTNTGTILTDNTLSHGIFAQSVGGGGGYGGFAIAGAVTDGASLSLSFGGSGGAGGAGGAVSVRDTGGSVATGDDGSHGIFAQSVGKGGGTGGFGIAGGIGGAASVNFAMAGSGGSGGRSDTVDVYTGSLVTTAGDDSHGVFAQSVGGSGGSGGFGVTGGISGTASVGAGVGGSGGAGGTADNVSVTAVGSLIETSGDRSSGILAQSVGGGGGAGGFSVAGGISGKAAVNFAMGGSGGSGGVAGRVTVDSGGSIHTAGSASHGIFAQSEGGAGGVGGFSVAGGISGGASLGASVGGSGGAGASSGDVAVSSTGEEILTSGERSYGIAAQSIGGTGGDGGFSVTGGIGRAAAIGFAMGGSGGGGGDAGTVRVDSASAIYTDNNQSHAIFAQSLGGGGGTGGFGVAGSIAMDNGAAVSIGIGGSGGDAAKADNVTVTSTGSVIRTLGDRAYGIAAQSIGGTGGDGGFTVAGGIGGSAAVNFGLGGSGGSGGSAGSVSVGNASTVRTSGDGSHGILAQSSGGGGGTGGFSVAGAISGGPSVSISIGGSGGDGAEGGDVRVVNDGETVATEGARSVGILAQSVGGTGGDGGFSVAGALSLKQAVTFSLGGGGGAGSTAGDVELENAASVSTAGADSHALFAQSLGGSGGSGGFSVAGSVSADNAAVAGVGISIGGFGDGGGDSGAVSLASTGGRIETFGVRSHGLFAQSEGGGGGAGGFSVGAVVAKGRAIAFSLGGGGGTAGNGSTVDLSNAGTVVAHGDDSHGLFAQSLGGGGGAGGFSVAGSLSADNSALSAVGISIGGFGGGGGNADNVHVLNERGTVVTEGARSHGIYAESTGGGGGAGGFSVAGGITRGGAATFSLGGFGDTAGHGGDVDVSNGGDIRTYGDGSHAIFAESTGGGGGSGGFSVAGSIALDNALATVGVSIGGFGAGGGNGGRVEVASGGSAISTAGDGAVGIYAQSVGGGGGDGGFSAAGGFALDNNARTAGISVGGYGGDGSRSGDVTVSNASAIVTAGNGSEGIVAQSVGGSGGRGGFSLSGAWGGSGSKNLSFSLGGGGGDGNYGGTVSVANDNAIDTFGFESHGIFAQSTGGSGGKGGWSVAAALGGGGDNTTRNVNLGVAIGGGGGDGNYGGDVTVGNRGRIVTRGDNAHAIFAQSLGGGGGEGGGAFAGTLATGASNPGSVLNVSVAVGGLGGDGNHGGAVSVENDGDLAAVGDGSHGIFAQSLGGGGGNGGKANSLSLQLDKSCGLPLVCKAPAGDDRNWSFAVSVGGFGGGASNGGLVDVANRGNIVTRGLDAAGIFAQSVGGGGGTGGNGNLGTDNVLPVSLPAGPETLTTPWSHVGYVKNWQAVVGGSGGSSGNGDNVTVRNTGVITTYGSTTTILDGEEIVTESVGSYGIFAQSVGGGGGVGGNAATGLTGKIGLGGGAGSAGDGGAVLVGTTGRIETYGDGGHAIIAQSGGGGGGIAGDVKRTAVPGTEFTAGLNLAFGRGGGNSGDGGAVTVDASGVIATHGRNAFGILAQSFGGGGGIASNTGFLGIPLDQVHGWFAGSVGGAGSGGAVTVRLDGTVATDNAGAHGIFAQSAGGQGTGGAVRVTVAGNVLAPGAGSAGIFAQSRGDAGGGDIAVDILSGTVLGGSGGGQGVRFVDGDANSLTNRGTIRSADGVAGIAVDGGTGGETVENHGLVAGSVTLGVGSNGFRNRATGTFAAGDRVLLGTGGTLANEGVLSPGGTGVLQTTRLEGNLAQSGSGTYLVDLDLLNRRSDRIEVTGTADLSGTARVNILDPGRIVSGELLLPIVSGDNAIRGAGLTLDAPVSAVVRYGLVGVPTELFLNATVDFAPEGLVGNQAAIGRAFNAFQADGGSEGLAPVVGLLYRQAGVAGLGAVLDQLSPATYDAYTEVSREAVRQGTRSLFKRVHSERAALGLASRIPDPDSRQAWRLAYGGSDRSVAQLLPADGTGTAPRYAMWGDGYKQWGTRKGGDGDVGSRYRTTGGVLGVDTRFGDRLLGGFAWGNARTEVTHDGGRGGGTVNGMLWSLYGSCFTKDFYLDGAVSAGRDDYATYRNVVVDNAAATATADHGARVRTASMEGGYGFFLADWILQPYAGIRYVHVREKAFDEQGAGVFGLRVGERRTESVVSELGARLERPFPVRNGFVLPTAGIAWSRDLKKDDRGVPASFTSAPGATFVVDGPGSGRDGAQVEAGVGYLGRSGLNASIKYTGDFRKRAASEAVLGELRYEF